MPRQKVVNEQPRQITEIRRVIVEPRHVIVDGESEYDAAERTADRATETIIRERPRRDDMTRADGVQGDATARAAARIRLIDSAEQPPVELLPAKPGPTWSFPVSESPSRRDEEPRWDSNGYRLNSLPRNVFPRPEPRGTHWSR
jgi:hypothetical protein